MLSFTNATGNLFTRLGKLGAYIANARSNQTTQQTALINTVTGIVAQFNAEPDLQAIVGDNYVSNLNSISSGSGLMQSIAEQTINRMVFRDNPLLNQNLQSLNTVACIAEVILQMKAAGATVLSQTITGTPGNFTGVGNGVVVFSAKRPLDGLVLENSYGETVLFTCSADSYSGGQLAGNEAFTFNGSGNESNPFAFDWPLGSNLQNNLNAIDGNTSNGSGNILTNSGFETWNSGVLSNFTLGPGVFGTNVFQETSLVYDGLAALRIQGDGATLIQLQQAFNSANGTNGTLAPQTQYSFNIFARRDGIAPAAGQWVVDLVDQNNVVINDANGVANTSTIDLTQLTTAYAAYNFAIRTPAIMPSSYSLRMRMPTGHALSNGRSVYFDKASLGQMTQLGVSSPFFSVHAGSTPFLLGDYASCVVTNSRGAAGTLSTWQTLLSLLLWNFIIPNEFLFPSSATPNVMDAWIA